MSGGGRRRWVLASLRVAAVSAVTVSLGWAAWKMMDVMRHGPGEIPAAMKKAPVEVVLVLVTDGVLDHPWAVSTLALPAGVSLLDLNLPKLREKLLASGQVKTANLTLSLPDTLAVTISERSPVARLTAAIPGVGLQELLVARDGVVFKGVDFDPAMIETLPWLEGFTLSRQRGEFLPIPGMEAVAELLAKAKLEAEERYRTWEVVSLARLSSDGELEVRTQIGTRIIFGTRDDYFRQLSRLDLVLDREAQIHPEKIPQVINLTFGLQVPVTYATSASAQLERAPGPVPQFHPSPLATPSSVSPYVPIKLKREL